MQLIVDRRAGRNEIGGDHDFAQLLVGELAVESGVDQAAQLEDADDIAELAVIHDNARVKPGRDLLADFVDRHLQVYGLDLAARRHDVFDRDVF